LSRETKKALFYHAEPRSQNRGGEAKRGKTKLFWSPGTIWPPENIAFGQISLYDIDCKDCKTVKPNKLIK